MRSLLYLPAERLLHFQLNRNILLACIHFVWCRIASGNHIECRYGFPFVHDLCLWAIEDHGDPDSRCLAAKAAGPGFDCSCSDYAMNNWKIYSEDANTCCLGPSCLRLLRAKD